MIPNIQPDSFRSENQSCCIQLGGTIVTDSDYPDDPAFSLCQNAILGGVANTIPLPEACQYLNEYGPVSQSESGGNVWGFLEGFDFGVVSNAYCNIAPLFSSGPVNGCAQPLAQGEEGGGESEGSKIGKIVLAAVLVILVAAIVFLIIRRKTKN